MINETQMTPRDTCAVDTVHDQGDNNLKLDQRSSRVNSPCRYNRKSSVLVKREQNNHPTWA